MTIFRNTDHLGTIGDTVTAADIDLDSISGTPTFVEGGYEWRETAVEYGPGEYGTRTVTMSNRTYGKTSMRFLTPAGAAGPSVKTDVLRITSAGGSVLARLRLDVDGRLQAWSGADADQSEYSTDTFYADLRWYSFVPEFNQLRGTCKFKIFYRKTHLQTLEVSIGAAAVPGVFVEGSHTAGTDLTVIVSGSVLSTEPQWIAEDGAESVIYIVGDDLSVNAFKHALEVRKMMATGVTFRQAFAATPLCAPDRAVMLSGMYAHNNGVLGNGGATDAYLANPDNEKLSIFNLLNGSRHTCHLGKWLHGYDVAGQSGATDYTGEPLWVPRGIDTFMTPTEGAYGQLDYKATLSIDGDRELIDTTGGQPLEGDYLTDYIKTLFRNFLLDHIATRSGQPFFAQLAVYVGHNSVGSTDPEGNQATTIPPAPRDRPLYDNSDGRPPNWNDPEDSVNGDLGRDDEGNRKTIADIAWPDYAWPEQLPNWHAHPVDENGNIPGWHNPDPITPAEDQENFEKYLDVLRQLQSLNDLIADFRSILDDHGLADKTWIIFTTDNGFRRGEFGLKPGKGAPYDFDCRLDYVVYPPGGLEAPAVVDAIIQPVDLLPTCLDIAGGIPVPARVDGRSWKGFVTGESPSEWRQTALIEYLSGDVANWQDALGTGEPPSWYALRSKDALYVTYDRDNPNAPDLEMAEAYSVPDDPAMLLNLWPSLAGYRQVSAANLLAAYLSGSGAASWTTGLQPFSLTGTGSDGAPEYVINGGVVELTDPARRWSSILPGTTKPQLPEQVLVDGRLPVPYGKRLSPALMKFRQMVTDRDQRGRPGGWSLLAENRRAMLSPVTRPFVLGERPGPGLGVAWEADAVLLGSVTPAEFAHVTEVVDLPMHLVDGFWRSVTPYTWGYPFFGPTADNPVQVVSLAGSSAPVFNGKLRIRGELQGFFLDDVVSKLQCSWSSVVAGVDALTSSQWLIVDLGLSWTAAIVDTDTWDMSLGVDVSSGLDANHAFPDLLVLNFVEWEGDPYDRRYYITGGGGGRSPTTRLEISAYRTKTA